MAAAVCPFAVSTVAACYVMRLCDECTHAVHRWVKDFLSTEQRGLDVLVSYLSSVLQQIVRSVSSNYASLLVVYDVCWYMVISHILKIIA